MIPFDELALALEHWRRRRQMEADLDGDPAPSARATPPQSFQAVPEENTNEIDVDDVIEEN